MVIVGLKGQADSILVLLLKEALNTRLELTVDMAALIISQDMFPNKILFHSLNLLTLHPPHAWVAL